MFWDNKEEQSTYGVVFNIEKYHIHDGAGIRTNVFLKGCNLWCPWCCNPESQVFAAQIAIHGNLCKKCGYCCQALCPREAIARAANGKIMVDKEKCNACGLCVQRCPHSARELYGKKMSVAEVVAEVEKDSAYYFQSGGGMTISGGEPCMQADFASELAKAAQRRYIHVAMETAGAVPKEQFWKVAQYVDELLCDLKFTDPEKFKKISGVPLSVVKENMAYARQNGKYVKLRCPIIPTLNDDEEHIAGIVSWAKELDITDVDILPFHQLGKYKYDSLDYDYTLGSFVDMDKAKAQEIADRMCSQGVHTIVGG